MKIISFIGELASIKFNRIGGCEVVLNTSHQMVQCEDKDLSAVLKVMYAEDHLNCRSIEVWDKE